MRYILELSAISDQSLSGIRGKRLNGIPAKLLLKDVLPVPANTYFVYSIFLSADLNLLYCCEISYK
mgnify:CR=1 FL=1